MANEKKTRVDALYIYDVKNGNPNGDPNMGNLPRVDPETGNGIVSDVSVKRRARDYIDARRGEIEAVTEHGEFGISMQHRSNLSALYKEATKETSGHDRAMAVVRERLGERFGTKEAAAEQKLEYFKALFWDARTFGAVVAGESQQIWGAVQVEFGESVDPVHPTEMSITNCGVPSGGGSNEGEDGKAKLQTMGTKHYIPYGLFTQGIHVLPTAAEQTGFTDEDELALWHALMNMQEVNRSSSRGLQTARKLVVFDHGNKWGRCPSATLFDAVKVERKFDPDEAEARSYSDYEVTIDYDAIPEGVTVTVYDEANPVPLGI